MKNLVNHVNIADSEGKVYCRKRKAVVELDDYHIENHCAGCDMFAGMAQGEGVECEWTDLREDIKSVRYVTSPYQEENQVISQDAKNKLDKPDLKL
jgi:hypothetical protein